jgi:hypothetical protein
MSPNPAHELGKAREMTTLELIQSMATSMPWILAVRLATRNEDRAGKDIVIETAHGEVYVQVKGCIRSVQEWRKLYRDSIGPHCVMVRFKDAKMLDPETLSKRLVAVYQLRIREHWARVAGVDIGGRRRPGMPLD